ncbi:zinc finger MYM-type protein 3 [Copidosoma floridanum]|uniref:zinc finger MYM-type protein 3 n=1 Tax=Copidosoma floridanum TaxID=29053 RepID=UPI0006C9B390|nr:zinc finger MYM-type protein 3 [Copidosoma floridanum]
MDPPSNEESVDNVDTVVESVETIDAPKENNDVVVPVEPVTSTEKPNEPSSESEILITNEVDSSKDKEQLGCENTMEVTEVLEINRVQRENCLEEVTPMEVDEVEPVEEASESNINRDESSTVEDKNKNEEAINSDKQKDISENNDQSSCKEADKSLESLEGGLLICETESSKDESKLDDKETSAQPDASTENENNKKESSNKLDETNKSSSEDSPSMEKESEKKTPENGSAEQPIQCDDVEMETSEEKESTNEKNDAVENTEFVLLNQEKDDSQLENQSDAVDPFEGDNNSSQTTNNVESMEVDSGNKGSKTAEEEVSSKNEDTSKDKEKGTTSNDENEKEVEVIQEEILIVEKSTEEVKETASTESSEKKSDESSDNILLNPNKELCIMPGDSTKDKTSDKEKSSDPKSAEKDKEVDEEDDILIEEEVSKTSKILENSEKSKNVPSTKSADKTIQKVGLRVAALTTESNDIQVNKSSDSLAIVTSDVIEIDDDAKNSEVEEISANEVCKQCKKEKPCSIKVKVGTKSYNVCSDACKTAFSNDNNKATDIPSEGVNSKREKRCANCLLIVEAKDERNLSWETMEFCNEECLGKFQTKYGSYCRNCNGSVQSVSLGKYCVRFGYDVRQFCCSTCLEEFKKGLKICSYCQKDISAGTEGFLAPVGDKGQFKDFCRQDCMDKYSRMNSSEPPAPENKICSVCQEEKVVHCEVQIGGSAPVAICSEPCFAAFKFVNKVDPEQCSTCKKYFQLPTRKGFTVFHEDEAHSFCNKTCLNIFIITNRKIVPCSWCKVKKYNFDMIKKELKVGQTIMMCSLNCLTLYAVSINAVSARRIHCDFCKEYSQAQYHLTMSDATIRNFCSYKCVMNFQAQYTKSPITIPSNDIGPGDPVPTGCPKRAIIPVQQRIQPVTSTESHGPVSVAQKKTMPVISSVTSLATIANGQVQSTMQLQNTAQQSIGTQIQPITIQGPHPVIYKQQIVTRPPSPVDISNKMTQCRPQTHTKGVSVRPIRCDQSTQTDAPEKIYIPIPIPIFVPVPVHMYHMPFPVPTPIPIPIPVPIFIPTTRNSIKGISKELKRIQEKIPADPYEAELLMMAEMVATEKKNESDSDSNNDEARDDGEVNETNEGNEGTQGDSYGPEEVDSSNAFGEDMLQIALKMATGELEESTVDLDTALTPSTIQSPPKPQNEETNNTENDAVQPIRVHSSRGRKRGSTNKTRGVPSKRGRRQHNANDVKLSAGAATPARMIQPAERPDANMSLKYTYGVNAWRQWVITKNAELEKQSTPTRKLKLFKTDLLQLTADELNYALCLFVKELRKPNGAEYEPDTIFYLCLGIQQYLFENNRIDNIFTDAYYEKFTDCLNETAKKFASLYDNSFRVITRVEEEHLWECKQLGAHSPHVLLNTLMYFNTKHFNLVSVEEHMQLSFSHIMKHWKRNSTGQSGGAVGGKVAGSRNVLLRFYPPQSALEANSKKKKVYEQQENENNPLRCPVKLYEFYLSKCPESVKTRNDVFYLLPERSCVPDSPVWYSTSPLDKEHLVKMLYRIKMVKEINVALLSS